MKAPTPLGYSPSVGLHTYRLQLRCGVCDYVQTIDHSGPNVLSKRWADRNAARYCPQCFRRWGIKIRLEPSLK